jgi:GTP pyrophosphokinase
LPLRTEIKNGDIVEVITAPYSNPNPSWLTFIKTGRARAAIRHALKTKGLDESLQLGERLLLQAIRQQEVDVALVTNPVWEKILHWTGSKTRQEVMTDIALGRRSAVVLAKRIELFVSEAHGHEQLRLDHQEWQKKSESQTAAKTIRNVLSVDGSEGMAVIFSSCCHPIPGDTIIGYLGKSEGLQIHIHDCAHVVRIHRKDPENWIEVNWAEEIHREFEIPLRVDIKNSKGVLAKVASSITAADANITHVGMDNATSELAATIRFGVQVKDRDHLAKVMRSLRANLDVVRVTRTKTHH